MKIHSIFPVMVMVLLFSGLAFAYNEPQDSSNFLLSVLFKAQELRGRATMEIRKIDMEIKKNEEAIQKSERIISLAQQKGNTKAEMVAKDALMKAQEAKKKNEETLAFYQFYKDLLNKKIDSLRQLTSTSPNPPEDCKGLEEQLERDKQALKNYMKTIDMANKENEEWGKEAEEGRELAEKTRSESINLLVDLIFQKILNVTENKVRGIEREINKYLDMKEPTNEYLRNRLSEKFQRALDHYKTASMELSILQTGKVAKDATSTSMDFYEATNNTIALVQRYNELGDKEIMEILHDPEIKKLSQELSSFLIEQSVSFAALANESSVYLNKLDYILKGAAIIRDTTMTGAKWYYTTERLEQLGKVADIQLKAVDSLSKQMERTMKRLKECREKAQKP